MGSVFVKMHTQKKNGTSLPIDDACKTFYDLSNCDSNSGNHVWTPPVKGFENAQYFHGPPRYYAVNLAPLPTRGTVEFRQNAGSTDPKRAQHWIQFVLAFVETFKSGAGLETLFDEGFEKDVADLKMAQTDASFEELFNAMSGHLDVEFSLPLGRAEVEA